jgi:Immunity protein 42
MIIGDQSVFAIESGITHAYERLSFRALGFFVIHINGRRYGVHSPNATMLACSFDEVGNRITRRGSHIASFATEPDADEIANAVCHAIYASDQENTRFFGISRPEFHDLVYSNHLLWAPDGDEAFDDGSHVLQFDVKNRVRLIAFKNSEEGYDSSTLNDMWFEGDKFYDILQRWRDAFETEWLAAPKISDGETVSP